MTSYRRDGKPSRTHNHTKNRRHRSGQKRGYHHGHGQVNSHRGTPGNPYTSGNHGGVPPSPASCTPAAARGIRIRTAHNPSGNPNARQPGTFRTGQCQLDGGTTHPTRPPTALSGLPPFVSQDARVPVISVCNKAAQIASVSSPRAPSPSVTNYNGEVPATETSVASAVPLSQGTVSTKGTRALCAAPLGHGPSSAKGSRAHSDVPLSRGKNLSTGVRVPNAAPLNHGKGACASRAAPPSHASRSNEAAATARRPPK